MNIKQIYSQASGMIDPREAEILLAHVLDKTRVYLHAHPEYELKEDEINKINNYIKRREEGEPIAYITGHREFYSLDFHVTSDVLIPRPETELLVDYILENIKQENISVLELGTGSGIIAISIAKHKKSWIIDAVDISEKALELARKNAKKNNVHNINFIQSNWFENIPPKKYNIIVSNPPYIAEHDSHVSQGDLRFEPQQALISGKEGLDALSIIISASKEYLASGGVIVLEHGYEQADKIQKLLAEKGFEKIETRVDLQGHSRMTIAKKP